MFNNTDIFDMVIDTLDEDFIASNKPISLITINKSNFDLDENVKTIMVLQTYRTPDKYGKMINLDKLLFNIYIGEKVPCYGPNYDIGKKICIVQRKSGYKLPIDLNDGDCVVCSIEKAKELILELSQRYIAFKTAVDDIKKLGTKKL